MLICTSTIKSRDVLLFQNSFINETSGLLIEFDLENIYDVVLINKPDIIVLDNSDLDNIHIKNLFNDIADETVNLGKTKLIVLIGSSSNRIPIKHNNIKYIPNSTYSLYNEYFVPSTNNSSIEYGLCNLDCIDHKNNNKLENLIYPKNKILPIKLVGCANIKNVQNLGMVSEEEFLQLLFYSKLYINIDNVYMQDAIAMGKPIIDLTNISTDNIQLSDATTQYSIDNVLQNKISNITKYIINI